MELIEATVVVLRGVTADTVNGRDVVIGPRCQIRRLDCSGTLAIHPKSVVETVTGTYVRKD